ncbi:hypothetical protein PMAYCL1PPCAC_26676 [Pristionchus mayeri]|uniref:Uncharacterized protein n=1 Tax=Pristionchus mayeri TaxID=1317129 RepID=A0AAN5D431_9BILA|nr:hypothetical protein PMAYCL1PPCAC_26676 [Pristionchus mayeri]
MSHNGGNKIEIFLDESSEDDRRHRRKHKKKHRRRSRSSSSSPVSGVGHNVHINPIMAHTIADAQMLQQRVTSQDVQIHHMSAELASAHARINVLEDQLARVNQEKALLEARCTPLEQQNARLIEQLDETKKVLQVLEPAVTSYQKTNENLTKEKIEITLREKVSSDEAKAAKNAYQSAKEQAEFVGKRNEVLAKKCEEVIIRNKQLEEDKILLCSEANRCRIHAEEMAKAITDLKKKDEIAEKERSTLAGEKKALLDRESVWRTEKCDMEKMIIYKESQIRSQKRQHDDEMHTEKDKYSKLVAKYGEQDSLFASEAAVNSVKKAVDIMRASLEEQILILKRRCGEDIQVEVIKQPLLISSVFPFPRIRSPSPVDRKRKK